MEERKMNNNPRNVGLPIAMSDEYWRAQDRAGHYYDDPIMQEWDIRREIVDRAIEGNKESHELLLRDDRINKGLMNGDYPIHIVSISKNTQLLSELIQKGVSVDITSSSGHTPLHYTAIHHGRKESVKLLVESGANINYKDNNKMTPLQCAVEHGDLEIVEQLIELGADVMALNDQGTSLHIAAVKGHVAIAKILVEKIPVDMLNSQNHSALHCAALNNNFEVLKVLAKAGANVNLTDEDGDTPVMAAIHLGNMDTVNVLLALGAQLDARNTKGQSPIHIAVKSPGIPTQLKKLNIDIHAKDNQGYTALHVAALEGGKEVVEELINIGIDKDAVDTNGDTPLHLAARKNRIDVARQFLKMNARTDIKNNNEKTAGEEAHTILAKEINNKTVEKGFFSKLLGW